MSHSLETLNLHDCCGLMAGDLESATLRCGSSLRSLYISYCDLKLKAIAEALKHAINLNQLQFAMYKEKCTQVEVDEFMAALSLQLCKIDMSHNKTLEYDSVCKDKHEN